MRFGHVGIGYTCPSYPRYTCLDLILTTNYILMNCVSLLEELRDSRAHWTIHRARLTESCLVEIVYCEDMNSCPDKYLDHLKKKKNLGIEQPPLMKYLSLINC